MESPPIIDLTALNEADANDEVACKDAVLHIFPDMCPDHLQALATQHGYQAEVIVSAVLDQVEDGKMYPTQSRDNLLKRKREDDDDSDDGDDAGTEEPRAVVDTRARIRSMGYLWRLDQETREQYQHMSKLLISQDFPRAPINYIGRKLVLGNLFDIYEAMDTQIDRNVLGWKPKKTPSKVVPEFLPQNLENLNPNQYSRPGERLALEEFRAARQLRAYREAKVAAEAEEQAEFARAQEAGETAECGCCFEEKAINRMAQCSGDPAHLFCAGCIKQQAETQVGYSKYELNCMSLEGCQGSFSFSQKKRFLSKSLRTALDRIEQEAMLREAGIETLETCPFCPYAADYPPLEETREFHCERPGCKKVSCRLCRRETHIPRSCAEVSADEGQTARREIEEAMSEALIRKCNNCKNPFVKSDGCNKIVCTRCQTIQCYVCRKTVADYKHFDDKSRGGKDGQCPLFDSTSQRHQNEVQQAEESARNKISQERPEIDAESLKFKLSDKVTADEKMRLERERQYGGFVARPFVNGVDPHAIEGAFRAAHYRLRAAHGHLHVPAPPPVPMPAPAPAPAPAQPGHIPPPFLANMPRYPHQPELPKDRINDVLRNLPQDIRSEAQDLALRLYATGTPSVVVFRQMVRFLQGQKPQALGLGHPIANHNSGGIGEPNRHPPVLPMAAPYQANLGRFGMHAPLYTRENIQNLQFPRLGGQNQDQQNNNAAPLPPPARGF